MKVTDLELTEFHTYYKTYIDKVPTNINLLEGLNNGKHYTLEFFKRIPKDKLEFSYKAGKWTIKEVFQHIIDTERILFYRCFRIARHDNSPLLGFDQDAYVPPSKANVKTIEQLIEEYEAVRNNTIVFLKSLSDVNLKFIGMVGGENMSARAAAFIIIGHEIHHANVLKQYYL